MNNKLIIMLSAKRCGSTAIFKIFQNNKFCKIAHKNQNIDNWEIQFWTMASKALKGNDYHLRSRLKECLPQLEIPKNLNKKKIFNLWDRIHRILGKTIFDKSPQYLGDMDALNLIYEYSKKNNVKIFCFIRNPLDAITSQHELWKNYTNERSLKIRERNWLKQYKNFEKFKSKLNILFFRYEDFVAQPNLNGKRLMNFCGIPFNKKDWSHIKPVSIGRYNSSLFYQIKNWEISAAMNLHIKKYKYLKNQSSNLFLSTKILMYSIKRYIPSNIKNFLKKQIKWIK